ncbi:hypothetical protein [Tolypothrix sp. VBCCA 56010]|uniref:hypothetical protein n=1 Tax=Tolypothrix sp. VBCCA 56010 TaxID=3137731 RepID=UPI003D7E0D1A
MKINSRLVLLNIALTLVLIFSINLLSNVILFISSQVAYAIGFEQPIGLPKSMKNGDLTQKNIYREFQQLQTRYEPFIGWSIKPFQGLTTNIDANGDRIHFNKVSQENLDKRVYFFGGSTVWGSGVSDEGTLPALFNTISGLPTSNKGESAFISRQSLAKFINLSADDEKINTAIFYDGINDVQTSCRKELKINEHVYTDKFIKILDENSLASNNIFLKKYLDILFIRGTLNLATAISHVININSSDTKNKHLICDGQEEKAKKVAVTLVNNWEIAHDIAVARGIIFFAVLQPVAFIGTLSLDNLESLEVYKINKFEEQYKAVYPIIKNIIHERGYDWIFDYTDLFSTDKSVYIDFAHVTESGNQIIAEQLFKDINNYEKIHPIANTN